MNDSNFKELFSSIEDLAAAGKLEEANRELQALIKMQESIKARAYNDLGVVAFQQGNLEEAMKHYQDAVKLAPENNIFRKNLADLLYFRLGETETALAHYRQVLQYDPRDFDASLAIGRICADLGRHFIAEATTFFSLAETIEPDNEMLLEEQKRLASTATIPEKDRNTLLSGPQPTGTEEDNDPKTEYADLCRTFDPDKPLATEEKIKDFLNRHPDFALACNDLGVISYQLGKPEESAHLYRKAVELAPDNATFRKNLADFIFVVEQDPGAAMPHYHKILQSTPQDTETLMMIGKICLEQGMLDDARSFFNLVLQIEPWHLEAGKALEMLDEQTHKRQEDGDHKE